VIEEEAALEVGVAEETALEAGFTVPQETRAKAERIRSNGVYFFIG
jgi:hypothetical protein